MSILDNNILEETDYSKFGFPRKDEFISPNTPYLRDNAYYVIDNPYLWKNLNNIIPQGILRSSPEPKKIRLSDMCEIKGVYIHWSAATDFISIGVTSRPTKLMMHDFAENLIFIDWLENFDGYINSWDVDMQDIAYQLVEYIKYNPSLIDRLVEGERINLKQLLNL